ncbi:MAG TPA: hypothetical protein VD947_01970, partial [Patescibacteria group bacterium]|nr:hypothetical protein [Patescibacteria group bacterium]
MNRWQGTLRAEDALEFLAAETGLAYNSPEGAIMARGIEAEVYQPFLSAMTVHAAERVKEGEFDVQSTVNALVIAAGLYADADEDYRSNPDRLQGEALKSHQGNVLDGTIQRVNPINATTFQQGRLQVIRATERLAGQPSEEQSVLAALNYGTVFDPKTMATAQETLERQEIDELLETVAGEYDEAMPHLTISNWAIGQIVAGIYDRASISSAEFRRPRVRVFDMGAGSGATLAAIISSINALQERDRGVELAISPIETTPELYEQLDSFIKNNPMIQDIGLHAVSRSEKGKASISQFGVLTAVKSDAVEEMCRFYVPFNNDVNVVVANYSWHRISKDKKGQLMERFADTDTIF